MFAGGGDSVGRRSCCRQVAEVVVICVVGLNSATSQRLSSMVVYKSCCVAHLVFAADVLQFAVLTQAEHSNSQTDLDWFHIESLGSVEHALGREQRGNVEAGFGIGGQRPCGICASAWGSSAAPCSRC